MQYIESGGIYWSNAKQAFYRSVGVFEIEGYLFMIRVVDDHGKWKEIGELDYILMKDLVKV